MKKAIDFRRLLRRMESLVTHRKLPRSGRRHKTMDLHGTFDVVGEPDLLERPDEVPAHVDLPPFQTEPSRVGEPMVISVPVLPPGRELQRAKPPQVLGRFAVIIEFAHMRDATHEALT